MHMHAIRRGLNVPPPLIYLAGLIIGFLAGKWLPNFSAPVVVSRTLGGLLIALSMVLAFSAMRAFRKVGTTIRPNRQAAALANAGPYRFTRNPMYLSPGICLRGHCDTRTIALGSPDFTRCSSGDSIQSDRTRGTLFGATIRRGVHELQGARPTLDLTSPAVPSPRDRRRCPIRA